MKQKRSGLSDFIEHGARYCNGVDACFKNEVGCRVDDLRQ